MARTRTKHRTVYFMAATLLLSGAQASADLALPNADILMHVVSQGETLELIAKGLGVTVRDLRASNQILGESTPPTGTILYAARSGLVHTTKSGQTLADIAATYCVPAEAIAGANGMKTSTAVSPGVQLVIPGASAAFWDAVTLLSQGRRSQFIWPLQGVVASPFGWRAHPVLGIRHHHDGIDIDVPEGATVHAAAGGKVSYYGEQPGLGNVLILSHAGASQDNSRNGGSSAIDAAISEILAQQADGFYTVYGHLRASLVATGQYVEKGQGIALSGNTGISSGPHLHFELRNGEFPIDPLSFLPFYHDAMPAAHFEITHWAQEYYKDRHEYSDFVYVYYKVTNPGAADIDYYVVWIEVHCADGSTFQEWTNGSNVPRQGYLTDWTIISVAGQRVLSASIAEYRLTPP